MRNSLSKRDIELIKGKLYDLDTLYEDSDDLIEQIIEDAQNRGTSYCIQNDTLIFVFLKELSVEKVKKIVEECEITSIVCLEIVNDFTKFTMKSEEVNEKIKEIARKTSLKKSNIHYTRHFLRNSKGDISIRIENIFNSIEYNTQLKKGDLYNYIFIANVNDIVEKLYGNLGDSLFDRNVRYEIQNTEGKRVEDAIRTTFRSDPDEFFLKNNGISLYVKNRKQIQIKLSEINFVLDGEASISVINGAQTIMALSKEIVENSQLKDAWILLRIYTLDDKESENSKEKEIDDITIALNQQKPINKEDIAMFSNFVESINNHKFKKEEYKFKLVKRGDKREAPALHNYLLKDFVQKVVAVIDKNPGKARSAPSKFLETLDKNEDGAFSIKEEDEIDIKYKPINLTFDIWKKINSSKFWNNILKTKKNEENEQLKAFKKYGKYLTLSILTNCLLGNYTNISECNDYNDGFKLKDNPDVDDLLNQVICMIYNSFRKVVDNPNSYLDSNDFKSTKEIYNDIICELRKEKEEIKEISDKIVEK